jgi:hypothetical protein
MVGTPASVAQVTLLRISASTLPQKAATLSTVACAVPETNVKYRFEYQGVPATPEKMVRTRLIDAMSDRHSQGT